MQVIKLWVGCYLLPPSFCLNLLFQNQLLFNQSNIVMIISDNAKMYITKLIISFYESLYAQILTAT